VAYFKENVEDIGVDYKGASQEQIFEKVLNELTRIKLEVEDYIEAKRLAFPRLFFLTERQFLEFVEQVESN